MDALLVFIERNAADTMFAVALVAIIYTFARLLKASSLLALTISFTPLVMIWAYSNGTFRAFMGTPIF